MGERRVRTCWRPRGRRGASASRVSRHGDRAGAAGDRSSSPASRPAFVATRRRGGDDLDGLGPPPAPTPYARSASPRSTSRSSPRSRRPWLRSSRSSRHPIVDARGREPEVVEPEVVERPRFRDRLGQGPHRLRRVPRPHDRRPGDLGRARGRADPRRRRRRADRRPARRAAGPGEGGRRSPTRRR